MHMPHRLIQLDDLEPPVLSAPPFAHASKRHHHVMVCLVHLIHTPPTISDHLRLRPPTLQCHSDAHCASSQNHTTPVTGLNSDQCLISPDFVPMSRATTYLSFHPTPHPPRPHTPDHLRSPLP